MYIYAWGWYTYQYNNDIKINLKNTYFPPLIYMYGYAFLSNESLFFTLTYVSTGFY